MAGILHTYGGADDPTLPYLRPTWLEGKKLAGAYWFGSSWPRPDTYDYSFNRRGAIPLTPTRDDHYFTGGASSSYILPITGEQLVDLSAGDGVSIACLFKRTTANTTMLISNWNGGTTTPYLALAVSGTAPLSLVYSAILGRGSAGPVQATYANDFTWSGEVWEMLVGVYTPTSVTLHRYFAQYDIPPVVTESTALPGGPGVFRVGVPHAAAFTSAQQIAGVALFASPLTEADCDALWARVKLTTAGTTLTPAVGANFP